MADEFRDFFSNFGEVKEQQIMRDHSTGRSRGFGFVTFESDQSVDDLLAKGNRLDFSGTQVFLNKCYAASKMGIYNLFSTSMNIVIVVSCIMPIGLSNASLC